MVHTRIIYTKRYKPEQANKGDISLVDPQYARFLISNGIAERYRMGAPMSGPKAHKMVRQSQTK